MRSEPIQISLIFLQIFSWNIEIKCQESPCPRLFIYEPTGRENDKWYGVVTLISDSDLNGVWVRLIFDRPLLRLELSQNWFGEVLVANNREYIVKNENRNLTANTFYPLRFHVKYDPSQLSPRLVGFQLNSQTVCPEELNTAVALPQLFTNKQLQQQTSAPNNDSSLNTPESVKDNPDNQNASPSAPPPTGKTLIRVTQTALCGMKPLIYNRRKAEEQWPWHVAIMQLKDNKFDYHCGGTLISEKTILTAAHCVTILSTSKLIDKEMFILYMGITRLSDLGEYFKVRLVRNVFVHKEFNPQRYHNDLAIVDMSEPVEFNDYIQPICLWNGDLEIRKLVGEAGTVVGWGVDNSNQTISDLMEAKMPVVALETCLYHDPAFFSLFTTPKTYCAGGPNASAVCSGDAGGGMVFPRRVDVGETVIWYLRGVVSVSPREEGSICNTKSYTVFSDVVRYLDWIKKTAGIS